MNTTATNNPELLEPADAAKYLGVSASTLAYWRSKGLYVSYCRVGGRRVMYRKADLDAFLTSRTVPGSPAVPASAALPPTPAKS